MSDTTKADFDPTDKDVEAQIKAVWDKDDTAERYASAEKATRIFAKMLVEKSGIANVSQDVKVLDMATGTGAVVQEIYDAVPEKNWGNLDILGADGSPPMINYLKKRGERNNWPKLETRLIDGNVGATPS